MEVRLGVNTGPDALRLRAATPADIEALADIVAGAYADSFATILEPAALAQRDAAFFRQHLAARLERVLLAERAGRPVAFSLVTEGHLDMMFVAHGERGHGAGAALLDRAEAAGARTLECFRDNLKARAFYEARGWRLARAYQREFIGATYAFVFYAKPLPSEPEPAT